MTAINVKRNQNTSIFAVPGRKKVLTLQKPVRIILKKSRKLIKGNITVIGRLSLTIFVFIKEN